MKATLSSRLNVFGRDSKDEAYPLSSAYMSHTFTGVRRATLLSDFCVQEKPHENQAFPNYFSVCINFFSTSASS